LGGWSSPAGLTDIQFFDDNNLGATLQLRTVVAENIITVPGSTTYYIHYDYISYPGFLCLFEISQRDSAGELVRDATYFVELDGPSNTGSTNYTSTPDVTPRSFGEIGTPYFRYRRLDGEDISELYYSSNRQSIATYNTYGCTRAELHEYGYQNRHVGYAFMWFNRYEVKVPPPPDANYISYWMWHLSAIFITYRTDSSVANYTINTWADFAAVADKIADAGVGIVWDAPRVTT